MTDIETFAAPDNEKSWNIYTVSLAVVGTAPVSQTVVATTAATHSVATTEVTAISGTGPDSGTAVQSTTASGNFAVKTAAPMMVMGGLLLGLICSCDWFAELWWLCDVDSVWCSY